MKINRKCMLQVIIENTIHSPGEYKKFKKWAVRQKKEQKKQVVFIYTLFHWCFRSFKHLFKQLRNECLTGYDNLPAKYLKLVINEISNSLTHIINVCIDKNIFPENWKISRSSLLRKVSELKGISDYRPISILPILSEVYEWLILNQIIDYIETQQLLAKPSLVYCKWHSFGFMLLNLKDDIVAPSKPENHTEFDLQQDLPPVIGFSSRIVS